MADPVLSVVLPVLDEPGLADFAAALESELGEVDHEVIVVDDSVHDGGALPPAFRRLRGRHRGKGAAVRDGVLASRGRAVLLMDADLGVLIGVIPQLLDPILGGRCDVAIAERRPNFGGRGLLRYILSFGLYVAQRLFVFHSFQFSDTQCGLKAFRGDVVRQMANRQRVMGGMYDIEYLYMARRNRLRIAQIPVGNVDESRPTKIRLFRCLMSDPPALMGVKWRGLLGKYRL